MQSLAQGLLWNSFLTSVGTYILSSIPWEFAWFFISYIGIYRYSIKDQEVCKTIQKKITRATIITSSGKRQGYSIGRWYILELSNTGYEEGLVAKIIGTKKSVEMLMNDEKEIPLKKDGDVINQPKQQTSLTIIENAGQKWRADFYKRKIKMNKLTPRPEQKEIITEILDQYKKNNSTVTMIYGPPGSGKSMLSYLLADELKANYINTFTPWEPGHFMAELYSYVDPSEEKPLVISFDEFDITLKKIHAGIPNEGKEYRASITSKSTWNHFLDEINRGMYPYIIIVLTSNISPHEIKSMDPSYIRPGRVDSIYELGAKEKDESASALAEVETSSTVSTSSDPPYLSLVEAEEKEAVSPRSVD